MRTLIQYSFLVAFGVLSILAIMTSEALAKGQHPTDLIAADLGVSEQVFVTCFADVQPDPSKSPSGARQRMNKDVLLPCLQAANANVSNDLLDEVMDCYRPEGPINR